MKNLIFTIALAQLWASAVYSKPIIITGHTSPKFRDSLYLHAYRYVSDFVVFDKEKTLVAATVPDANGNFKISYNGDGKLFYMNYAHKLDVFHDASFVSGDSLFVEIVDTSFGGKPYQFPFFHFYGSGAYSINYEKKMEQNQIPAGGKEHKMGNMTYYEYPDYGMSLDSFSRFVNEEKVRNDSFINSYFKEVKAPASFVEIAKMNNDYTLKKQRLTYIWRHDEGGLSVRVEPSYFNFVSNKDLNNVKALDAYRYYFFLSEYPDEIMNEMVVRLPEKTKAKRMKTWDNKILGEKLHIIDSLYKGRIREIACAQLIDNTLTFLRTGNSSSKVEIMAWVDSVLETIKPVKDDPMDTSIYSCLLLKRNKLMSLDNAKAPEFALRDQNGKTVSLADYKGKVVLLDFWEYGCMPCMQAIPGSNQLQNDLSGKDFAMVAICQNTTEEMWKDGIDKFHWKGVHLFDDGKSQIGSKYSVDAYPHYVIIDKKGIIRESNANPNDLKSKIGKLLEE